jgi:uncharacterized membrane protein
MFDLILLGKASFDHAYKKQDMGLMKTKGIYRPYLLQSVFTLIIIIIIIIILFFFFQIMKPP